MRPHARRWPPARARTPRGQHGLAGAAIVLGHGGAFLGVQLGGRALDSTRRKSLGLGLSFSKNTELNSRAPFSFASPNQYCSWPQTMPFREAMNSELPPARGFCCRLQSYVCLGVNRLGSRVNGRGSGVNMNGARVAFLQENQLRG